MTAPFIDEAAVNVLGIEKRVLIIVAIVTAGSFPLYAGVSVYGGDFDLPIPASPDSTKGWMDDALIKVPDHITIDDLDVGISLTHSNVFDLKILLESPSRKTVCLNMYNFDEFFEGANYTQTIFDDEADVAIERGKPPFTGRFRPRAPNRLGVFDGQDAAGIWRLKIYDAHWWDSGKLNHAELIISTPGPASVVLLTLAVVLMPLIRPRPLH